MEVHLVEIPEPATDEMVGLLHAVLTSALDQARLSLPFTNGDVMSACLDLMTEVGIEGASPKQLRKDIVAALDLAIDYYKQRKATMQ